jgi:hypothetical protein
MAVNGFSAQSDRRLLFGLGSATGPVEVKVLWCREAQAESLTLETGRYHRISMKAGG